MKGWRTITLAAVAIVAGAVLFLWGPESSHDMAAALIGAGLVGGGLRTVTSTPIGRGD